MEIFKKHLFSLEKEKTIKRFGWKIHISSSLKNYQITIDKVKKYCLAKKIPFKYVKHIDEYKLLLTDKTRLENSAKLITIYSFDRDKAKLIIEDLSKVLKSFKGPSIPNERKYSKSNVIFYRYGNFFGLENDSRDKFWLPNDERDLFEQKYKNSSRELLLNERYKILGVFSKKTTGNVFLARDLFNEIDVVIKHSRKFTISESKENIFKIRKREIFNSKKLEELEYFPKFLDSFFIEGDFFTVWEKKNGKTFYQIVNEFNIELPNKSNNLEKFYSIKEIIASLDVFYLKTKNVVSLNDLSLNNFIWDEERKKTYFIDLADSFLLEDSKTKKIYKKLEILTNPKKSIVKKLIQGKDIEIDFFILILNLLSKNAFILNLNKNVFKSIKMITKCLNSKGLYFNEELNVFSNLKHKNRNLNKIFKLAQQSNDKNIEKLKPLLIEKKKSHNYDDLSNLNLILNIFGKKKMKKFDFKEAINSSTLRNEYKKFLIDIETYDFNNSEFVKKEIEKFKNEFEINFFSVNYIKDAGGFLNPYISEGTFGLIVVMYFFNKKFQDSYFDYDIKKYLEDYKGIFTVKTNFFSGSLGIALIYLLIGKEKDLSDFKKEARRIFLIISNYMVIKNKLITSDSSKIKKIDLFSYNFLLEALYENK